MVALTLWQFSKGCKGWQWLLMVHPEDQTQPTFEMTPGFKPFTVAKIHSKVNSW